MKTDNYGNTLSGVKFALEDSAGNKLRHLVSGDDSIVHVAELAPGSYTIREIETLEGYSITEETITIVIDEKYIPPTEMHRLVNYPNIQTGVDFVITHVMWVGAAMVLVAVAMITLYFIKLKQSERRKSMKIHK